jgi:hypothetical protein
MVGGLASSGIPEQLHKISKIRVLLKNYARDATPPLTSKLISIEMTALLEIKFYMLISIENKLATLHHMVVVWREMVIDYESMFTYPLTEDSLRQIFGVNTTFIQISSGCRSPDSWERTVRPQIWLTHLPTPPQCSTRAIIGLINNLGIVYHQYFSS